MIFSENRQTQEAPGRFRPWAIVRSTLLSAGMLATSLAGNAVMGTPAAQAAVPTAATVNNPPATAGVQILVFPQRDFISASGYLASDVVQVSVIHPSGVSYTTGDVVPQPDPRAATGAPFAGIVEVNHPGGACWPTTTPDIRPGDKVRITITANPAVPARVGVADETTVRNVTAGRPVQTAPGTVQIHGTAVQADGVTPLPLAELEQRMVANRDAFLLNGRRTLRATAAAGADGTLAYDAAGSTSWTATYAGLQPADVTRALNAESRVLWTPAALTEGTIYENGAGIIAGPAAPCTAPLEKLPPPPGADATPPTTPTLNAPVVSNGNTVALSWTAATDNVGVIDYGVYRDGIAIATVQNATASAPAPTSFTDVNVPPGTYTYTVDAGDAAGNRSTLSNGQSVTTVRPVATLPAGTVINEPPVAPIQIISFPARDFISSSGFLATDSVDVQVLRKEGGQLVLVSSASWTPQPDPRAAPDAPFAGIVEVNHPGGACWTGTTPDIRAGDIIREIAYNPDGTIRVVNQTTTSNVVDQRPVIVQHASSAIARDGVVQIHGMAMDANGNAIDPAQVEQRLVANRDAFDLNGRRTLRAGGAGKDGTFSYDTTNNPTGVNWTATYTGLSEDDVMRAAGGTNQFNGRAFTGAESRALWLSATPAAAPEITIYENDGATAVVNGPAAGVCTAPQEPLDTAPPTFATAAAGLTATQVAGAAPNTNDVALSWTAASDNVAVYGYRIYRDGQPLHNVGGATTTYTDKNVVGLHTYTIDATDAASPGVGGNAQGTPYGNRSAQSTPAASITVTDVSPPSVPTNLTATVGAGTVTLNWSASTDNVGVAGYGVYRNGTKLGADVAGTSFTDNLSTAGTYSYTVDAVDAAGNRSAQSAAATANVTTVPDAAAPSAPAGLTAITPDVHVRNVQLAWTASTDNVGVTGYGVYRRQVDPSAATQPAFVKVADLNATAPTYTDANVPAGTYDYAVDAVDSAGNRSAQSTSARVVTAGDPPTGSHQIIPFPARDFVSSTGYAVTEGPITISVLRKDATGKWFTFADSTPINVVEDPATPGLGAAEVNHPGGGCWNTVTPNLVSGDIIRYTNKHGIADQTTIANVWADRPIVTAIDAATGGGTVVIHGTAQDALGNPLPATQVETRLIANRDAFDLNGRRTVRAGGAGTDGTFSYDPVGPNNPKGIKWTATYIFGTANDLARAAGGTSTTGTQFVGAESRAMWLGRDGIGTNEITTTENGSGVAGGPVAGITGCTSGPAETPAPGAALSAAPTFAATAIGSTSAAQPITLTNNGTAPLHVDHAYIAGLNPGDFTLTLDGATGNTVAPGASVSVSVAFKPTAAGQRQANLSFTDDAANTTDQTVPLVASTPATAAAPTATAPIQSLAGGGNLAINATLANSTIPVTLNWSGNGPAGTKYELQQGNGLPTSWVTVTPAGFTGTDFTVNLRMGTLLAPGGAYQFQVRACDSAGRCGAWAQGPKFNIFPIDDGVASTIVYNGNWTTEALAGSYGGTVHWTAGSGTATIANKVTFTITGNVAWVSTVGPDRGLAQVQVDGKTPQVVDLYQPTQQTGKVVWAVDNLTAGTTHTVTITVLGKKSSLNPNPCTTGNKCARVDVDMAAWFK